MRRLHLFEFEDQAWFPAIWRSFATDFLQFSQTVVDQSAPLAEPLARLAAQSEARRFVDLCSGSSGPWGRLTQHLADGGCDLPVVLTDLHPTHAVFDRVVAGSGGRIAGCERPVDARDVPADLQGIRTLLNGFHHFDPATARAILQDAVDAGQPIAVAEFVSRSPIAILGVVFAALIVTPLATLAIRPFRFSRLLFTYLIPIVPLVVLWDGVVSCLRIYSPRELDELVAELHAPGWRFEVKQLKNPTAPVPITLLVGAPASGGDGERAE